jgi:hypothetical protein
MTTSTGIERLAKSVPPSLEAALNYDGKARWVAIYRDRAIAQGTGWGLVLYDGRNTHVGDLQIWKLFADKNPSLRSYFETLTASDSDVSDDALLLDRKDRNLYKCEQTAVEGFLTNPKVQKLLLELHRKRPKHFDRHGVIAIRLGIGLLAAIGLGAVGYGAYLGISNFQENPVVIQQPESPRNSQPESSSELSSQDIDEAIYSLLRMCAAGMGLSVAGLMVTSLIKHK